MSRMDDDLFTYEVEVANIPCDSNKDEDSKQRMSQEANDDTRYDLSYIYWIRGDDEVELTDEEFYNNADEVAKVFRIDTNIFDFETPMCKAFKEFNYLFWKKDGYCNGGNLPRAYVVGNSLHYQDCEWYEALMDNELKEQALRNKAIMEGSISDDKSSNDGWRIWKSHEITITMK
nr:hypothetical protein [Tanacetum cinerariifolium]GEX33183.1 hypothetical protein [Tanacetum cinerariifolium]GEX79607.1 hypothetical protein [Tanacetum cinerariifolium]